MSNEFMNTVDGDRYCSVTEISRIFRISRTPIYNLLKEKKIPSVRVGNAYRVKISDMRKFVQNSGAFSGGLYGTN